MPQHYAEVACENCGTDLLLRYGQYSFPFGMQPSIGCPECQATTSVVAKWRDLERDAAPEFIHLTALVKKTEIGLASETTMTATSTAQQHANEDDL